MSTDLDSFDQSELGDYTQSEMGDRNDNFTRTTPTVGVGIITPAVANALVAFFDSIYRPAFNVISFDEPVLLGQHLNDIELLFFAPYDFAGRVHPPESIRTTLLALPNLRRTILIPLFVGGASGFYGSAEFAEVTGISFNGFAPLDATFPLNAHPLTAGQTQYATGEIKHVLTSGGTSLASVMAVNSKSIGERNMEFVVGFMNPAAGNTPMLLNFWSV